MTEWIPTVQEMRRDAYFGTGIFRKDAAMPHSNLRLPTGNHWGLDIFSHPATTTGSLSHRPANKLVWHTTEGLGFVEMDRVLRNKGDEPHFLIDPYSGRVMQYMNLDEYAKALEHPSGTPETNRAGAIQVEVIGFARDAFTWPIHYYENLASLAVLIEHRTAIPRKAPVKFSRNATRITPSDWAGTAGHVGHEHAPSQPGGHWDPGTLNVKRLFFRMETQTKKYM